MSRRPVVLTFFVFISACGKGLTGPSATPTGPTKTITFTAFLDENGNKVMDASEVTRIPGVEISSGSIKALTGPGLGQATLQLPESATTVDISAASLPPFYRPPSPATITLTASGSLTVPITLSVGSNRVNTYLAFGDSITNGEADIPDGNGYRNFLQTKLQAALGAATIINDGIDATRSDDGATRIGASLSRYRPAFTLIFYGTNDWNDPACDDIEELTSVCFTVTSLRTMVRQVNQSGGHAFLASLLPINVGYDGRATQQRQDWVNAQNSLIRQMADQEGAVYVDNNTAFYRSGIPFPVLFVDHIHPVMEGYQIMAQTFFDAITKPYTRILSEEFIPN